MPISDDVLNDIQNTLSATWSTREGRQVPESDSIALAGGAVQIDATFLYADLANSSRMAKVLDVRVAAKIIKSFLATTSRLIRSNNGSIVSFDGDRIMGVFYGDFKNSNAAKCALQIKWAVSQIRIKYSAAYESVRTAGFTIAHGVGVDTGTVLAVRAGARGANDLIWIGRPPNLAAKLSDVRDGDYSSFITATVFNKLHESSKLAGTERTMVWERRNWTFLDETIVVYRSNYSWKP
jgi:adenylate cyclase